MSEQTYPLIAIERLRMTTDGDGVTTLVAGAGCPLQCAYCINKRLLKEAPSEQVSAEELVDRVRIDELYFWATGGGVTFGGGESLLHAGFIRRFREVCPPGWKIYVETSLAVPSDLVRESIGCVNEYIVDCKDMNPDIYHRYTGGDSQLMTDNLRLLLDAAGPESVVVRVPLIPSYNNEENRQKTIKTLQSMGVTRIDAFSYVIK